MGAPKTLADVTGTGVHGDEHDVVANLLDEVLTIAELLYRRDIDQGGTEDLAVLGMLVRKANAAVDLYSTSNSDEVA